MCWQRSRTYSWHGVGCYAVRDWGNSVSAEGEICLRKAGLCLQKDEIRPIQPQKRCELFISSKLQLWVLFCGSLPRGSLGLPGLLLSGEKTAVVTLLGGG